MKGAICGKPSKLDPMNKCDVNSISNPDNIWYDNKYNSLFIAEDTSNHQNDVMWQFDPITGSLTRTLSSPYGSEITSTEFHHFGECDIMEVVFQHPYGESDQKMLLEKGNSGDGAYLSYMRMPVKQQLVTPSTTTAPSSATTLAPASSSALKVATSSSLLAAFLVVSGMLML
jgi:secreted PhoX family phosphatase